jgi:hypothetical protein
MSWLSPCLYAAGFPFPKSFSSSTPTLFSQKELISLAPIYAKLIIIGESEELSKIIRIVISFHHTIIAGGWWINSRNIHKLKNKFVMLDDRERRCENSENRPRGLDYFLRGPRKIEPSFSPLFPSRVLSTIQSIYTLHSNTNCSIVALTLSCKSEKVRP